jgi:hypothetical protein
LGPVSLILLYSLLLILLNWKKILLLYEKLIDLIWRVKLKIVIVIVIVIVNIIFIIVNKFEKKIITIEEKP